MTTNTPNEVTPEMEPSSTSPTRSRMKYAR